MNFVVTYREKDGSRNQIAIEADDRAGVFPILRERGISAIRVEEGELSAKDGRSKWPTSKGLKLLLAGCALLSLVAVALTIGFRHPNNAKVSKTTVEEQELAKSIEKTSPVDEKPQSGYMVADRSAAQVETNSKPVITQATQNRLPPSQAKKLTGPKSETVDGVAWFYEIISNANQTCARIIPNKERGAKEYVGALTIPSSLGGFPVICIGEGAFSGCGGLNSVTIPESVTDVGRDAFRGCTKLTAVTIPSSVTRVGFLAFYDCRELTSVTIPAGVRSIDGSAFWSCGALKSILVDEANPFYVSKNGFLYSKDESTLVAVADGGIAAANGHVVIPSGVTTIGAFAFAGCRKLESVTIPSSVTGIGRSAFDHCTRLASLLIPSSVTKIGSGAFYDCSGLTSVAIHATVENIEWWTFFGCSGLTSVKIPASVKYIGSMAFCGCTGLTSVTIPAVVRSIDGSAFGGCSALKSILVDESNPFYVSKNGFLYSKDESTLVAVADGGIAAANGHVVIPSGVTCIGGGAFNRCSTLASVTIPPSVTNIGYAAFSGCSRLESVTVPMADKGDAARIKNLLLSGGASVDKLKFIEMPKGGQPPKIFTEGYIPSSNAVQSVRKAGMNPHGEDSKANRLATAVPHCGRSLDYKSETVDGVAWQYYISNGVAVVEHPIISGRLRGPAVAKEISGSVAVPNKLGGFPVGGIGRQAFSGLGVTKVSVPPTVTIIDSEAFDGCKSLSEVVLPDSVRSIEWRAFYWCTNLVSATVPDGLTHIGGEAFQGCRRLAGFTIPTNCVSIGARAFEGCDALVEMKIPTGVRKIGDRAFSGLQSFVVDEQDPTFRHIGGGLYDKGGTRLIGYPCTGVVARISATVTNISESACKDLGSAKSIEVDPENRFYKSVGGCLYDKNGNILLRCPRSMSRMEIPNGVKCIGPYAFEANAELVDVSFPTSVVEIGVCAFNMCRGLASVSIPENVTNISGCAFRYCTSLKTVTIPSSVRFISDRGFANCYSLKSVVLKPGVESIGSQAFISCPRLSFVHFPPSAQVSGRLGAFRAFDVWGQYTYGPNVPRRSLEDGALTFVVKKGDEERVGNLLCDKMYERRRRMAQDRGLLCPEIKVVTEDECQGGKSPDKADKDK